MKFTGERLIPAEIPETDGLFREHIERYLFAMGYVKEGDAVLDVACGTGYGTYCLSSKAEKVYGVDISSEAIEYAKGHYGKKNIVFAEGKAVKLDFPDNSFGVVCSFETIEHLSESEEFLQEIKRVLKPGGILVISTPNRETYPGGRSPSAFHKREFSLSEISGLLEKHFRDIEIYVQKMAYFTRPYKKLRLLLRYPSDKLRKKATGLILKCFKTLEKAPRFFRIFLYEWEYPYTVLPQFEKGRKIRPTFFIFACKKAGENI